MPLTGAIRNPPKFSGTVGAPVLGGAATRTGPPGPAGKSAYEIAVANGFVGTEAEWLASLQGSAGATALADLSDVDLTAPADGDRLAFDSLSALWRNSPVTDGGFF